MTGQDFSMSLGAFLAGLNTDPHERACAAVARSYQDTLVPEGLALIDISDSGDGLVVYDLAEWPTGARIEFEGELQERNIEHVWHLNDLLVPDRLEFTLDELIDDLADVPGDEAPSGTDAVDLARFDLDDWEPEERILLDLRLAGSWATFMEHWGPSKAHNYVGWVSTSVPHSWEEATLVVREHDADLVDGLIGAFESAVRLALDPQVAKVAYDLSGFTDEALTAALDSLVEAQIHHELTEEEELVVHEDDEEAVERIFDAVSFPDELPVEDDPDGPHDGLVAQDVLSELFVAADRLRRDGRNPAAVLEMVEAADRLDGLPVPFGFAAEEWSRLGTQARDLAQLLESGDFDAVEVEEQAERMREVLRPLV